MMEVKTGMGSLGIGSRSSFSPQESDLKGIHHAAGNLRIAVYAAGYQVKLVTLLQTTHLSLLSLQQNRVIRDDGPAVPARPFQAAFQMHKTNSEQRASSHKSVALERATTQLNIVCTIPCSVRELLIMGLFIHRLIACSINKSPKTPRTSPKRHAATARR